MKLQCLLPPLLCILITSASPSRILILPAHNIASHTKSMYPVAEALAATGRHEIVVLQLINDKKEICKSKQSGLVDLVLKPNVSLVTSAMPKDMYWKATSTSPIGAIFAWKMATDVCMAIHDDENTRREFERIVEEDWDLVMVDSIFTPCGIIAMHEHVAKTSKKRRPLIAELSTSFLLPSSLKYRGVPVFASTYPTLQMTKFENARFMQRWSLFSDMWQVSFIMDTVAGFLIPNVWSRGHPYARSFRDVTPAAMMERVDFAIGVMSPLLDFPKASSVGIGETDTNCPSADSNSLAEPYASFVDDPKSQGTILFAMGHFVDWTFAPPGAIVAFINAFARLSNYRIIWQFAQDASKLNVSSNVLVEKWIPQMAILDHPKTQLFISHMGMKSIREAICAKVPVAAMPMFAEQGRNTAMAQHRGIGVHLDKLELTSDYVHDRLTRVLNDRRFADSVSKLQDQLDDRLRVPLDLIVFKTEFMIKWNSDRFFDEFVRIRGSTMATRSEWSLDLIFGVVAISFVSIGMLR